LYGLEAALDAHPLAGTSNRDPRLRAVGAIERLERDEARLERRVKSRSDSLARQFDRVLRVLESWDYVDGWSLTSGGETLARLYTETDLLLAESLRQGLFDGLSPPELAAVVSCFTYERRGPDDEAPTAPLRWPSSAVATSARAIDKVWCELVANEDDAGLPETRQPDPGFTTHAFEWASGDDLASVLDDDELTGGDFVRHIKQCIDLLRQVGDVAADPETRRAARDAANACHRGVVAAGGVAAACSSAAHPGGTRRPSRPRSRCAAATPTSPTRSAGGPAHGSRSCRTTRATWRARWVCRCRATLTPVRPRSSCTLTCSPSRTACSR
jgi:ATP-dependent RNA helicase HelY